MATRTYAVPGTIGDFDDSGIGFAVPGIVGDINVGTFVPPPSGASRPWHRPDLMVEDGEDEPLFLRRRFAPPIVTVTAISARRKVALMEIATEPQMLEMWFPRSDRPQPPSQRKKMRPYLQLNS